MTGPHLLHQVQRSHSCFVPPQCSSQWREHGNLVTVRSFDELIAETLPRPAAIAPRDVRPDAARRLSHNGDLLQPRSGPFFVWLCLFMLMLNSKLTTEATEVAAGRGDAMTQRMGRVICDITISADGYSAGLNQTEDRPFGDDGDGWGDKLHAWLVETPEENRAETDQMTAARAFIMGRNVFGPVRGEWDRQWNGWWGDDRPFHAPVFVLTHHAREPEPMEAGTTYYFITDGRT